MLEINPGILAVQVITFLVALGSLWLLCWKPLCATLEERRDSIRRDLELVQKTKETMARTEAEYRGKLADIERQAQEMIAAACTEGERQKAQIIAAARQEAKDISLRNAESTREENNKLLLELYREISGLSVELAEKLMRKTIRPEDQFRFVREALDELQKTP